MSAQQRARLIRQEDRDNVSMSAKEAGGILGVPVEDVQTLIDAGHLATAPSGRPRVDAVLGLDHLRIAALLDHARILDARSLARRIGVEPSAIDAAFETGVLAAADFRDGAPRFRLEDGRAARDAILQAARRSRRTARRRSSAAHGHSTDLSDREIRALRDGRVDGTQPARDRARARLEEWPVTTRIPHLTHRRVVVHCGPTGSGKTHDAMTQLVAERSGVVCAPLRMLALEMFTRLSEQLGEEHVGLATGEEKIRLDAPVLCCTTELAPLRAGDRRMLIVDEAHWAQDEDRGWAWTRVLAGADYPLVHVATSADALPLLRAVFDGDLEVRHVDRLVPLTFNGTTVDDRIEPGTVIVAFSRRSVLALTHQLRQRYGQDKVVCLYGAMPPHARRSMIERFLDGRATICVATDVIGHGINLPCSQVLFAETEKFDGREFRDLHLWEAAQIAGRAGRYGLTDSGKAGVLRARGFQPQPSLVRSCLTAPLRVEDGARGYRRITRGPWRPILEDLRIAQAADLPAALLAWETDARAELGEHAWADVGSVEPMCQLMWQLPAGALAQLSLEQAWGVATAPLDPGHDGDMALLRMAAADLVLKDRALADHLRRLGRQVSAAALGDAEDLARAARNLRWLGNRFPELALPDGMAESLELSAARRVYDLLCSQKALRRQFGICFECGSPCPNEHDLCTPCHRRGRDELWEDELYG